MSDTVHQIHHTQSRATVQREDDVLASHVEFQTAEALQQRFRAWGGSFPEFMADLDARQVPYLSHSKVRNPYLTENLTVP